MTTALASSARRAIRSRNTKFFVSVAWGKDGPLVGIARELFFGRGGGLTRRLTRGAPGMPKNSSRGRFFRCEGTISCGRSVPKAVLEVSTLL